MQAKIQRPKNVRGEQGRVSRFWGAVLWIAGGNGKVRFSVLSSGIGLF
jgi:hypothetical protein